jgi:hypothetical protein
MKQFLRSNVLKEKTEAQMASKDERVELAMKIIKYRNLARLAPDPETAQRIKELVAELEQKLREIDE